MTCQEIRCLLKTIMQNVTEAREKIHKAIEWKDKHRGIADWQKQMAVAHLEFNTTAMQMVRAGLQEIRNEQAQRSEHTEAHHMLGKCDAYQEWLDQIAPETAEVKAMIDGYGR